ncbi:hypothetical protein GSH19_02850 [Lactobacillus sp. S2-2]|uniref:hypothetical protein n=1 Tax=Lactobacillus sp. S2-2 TaxID=2692917 RepID=UPI001F1FE179|nr:hypothetical protein [Lactobacillus sp. S2-2]MCF6515104.1 hypothetical protein [Lactobacillus sp. S2-2]
MEKINNLLNYNNYTEIFRTIKESLLSTKQLQMPENQIDLFLNTSIKNHYLINVQYFNKINNNFDVISGTAKKINENKYLFVNSTNISTILNKNQIRYIEKVG